MLVGQKTMDQTPFCEEELRELFEGTAQVVSSGTPPSVPAAVPLGHLVRIVASLKAYHDLVQSLTTFEFESADVEAMASLQAEACALINIAPPKATSRLVVM